MVKVEVEQAARHHILPDIDPHPNPAPEPGDNPLGVEVIVEGAVEAFSVSDERLLIKLRGPINRWLVSVDQDAPWYRSAVSLTMMAYNNSQWINVRGVNARGDGVDAPATVHGREVGLGPNAFDVEDWPTTN